MNPFQYSRPAETAAAIKILAKEPEAFFLAGGTNLIDLMKMGVVAPDRLVDINRLPLSEITTIPGGLRLGALATNSAVADHPLVLEGYPLLSLAINAGASPQLRNMATVGGNLMQRTRCSYFFDVTMPCNKRAPGSGCGALEGINRMHAIFGASDKCIAVNPSDMSVAMAALDATVRVKGPAGERVIKFQDFHRLPGDQPESDNTLQKGELIVAVDLPAAGFKKHVHYLKVRDRSSFAFALVSVAAALDIDNTNTIREARLAMGGVAHKPWRLFASEEFLKGKAVSEDVFAQAARLAMEGAKAYQYNQFKLKLAPNAIRYALKTASGLA
ncbi:MAG TPA: xanthine dehydrogenase family protein subunit M [Puia sp.]|jgi:xanthine dehydrogenase YagS FAD-binding subunit|nr:xanthine dehydrogenase family protein subunit M [Puia sp.]